MLFVGMVGAGIIDGSGQSSSTTSAREQAIKHFNKWRESLGLCPINDMEEEEVCSEQLISQFAYYLVKEYKKKDDESLKLQSVLASISNLMNSQSRRFTSTSAKTFFSVLGSNGDNNWYSRVRYGIKTAIRRRSIEQGLPLYQRMFVYLLTYPSPTTVHYNNRNKNNRRSNTYFPSRDAGDRVGLVPSEPA
jgi:hypothetical protein